MFQATYTNTFGKVIKYTPQNRAKITSRKIVRFNRYLERGLTLAQACNRVCWFVEVGEMIKKDIWGDRKNIAEFCRENNLVHDEDYPLVDN